MALKHHAFLSVLCLGLSAEVDAQYVPDSSASIPRVCDLFLMASGQGESMYAVGIDQWRALAPRSVLLAKDLSDHPYAQPRDQEFTRATGMAGALALRCGHPRTTRNGTYLRIGFSFLDHTGHDLVLRKETRTPFDTLTSSQSGQVTYVDSVTTSQYRFEHTYSEVCADGSLVFLREYPKHWSLYGGVGARIGFAFNGRVRIEHDIRRRTDPRSGGTSNGDASASDRVEEEFRTKDDPVFAVYVPLGASYRLSKKHPFWSTLNLAYELRPTLSFGGVPELSPGARAGVSQHFGLRVDLTR